MSARRKMLKIESHNRIFIDKNPQKTLNYKVYKHNKLIESKSDFSAMEHRIIVLALAQITEKDENLKMYNIKIQDVLGKKNNTSNYDTVRKAVRRLHKCTIDIEEINGWKSYAFIIKAQGEYGENYIEIQFHEDIQKFLLGLKSQYTSYTLDNVMKFRRNYSLRIYEFCKQYLGVGSRIMKLDYLRNLLSLEYKYPDFCSFKAYVLITSLEEINKYSDIKVQYNAIKKGRNVDSLNFIIKQKPYVSLQDTKTTAEVLIFSENQKKLESLGFADDEINLMRKQNTEDKISTVLELYQKNIDEVNFPKPWLKRALKENFTNNTEYKKILETSEADLRLELKKTTESLSIKIKIKTIRERITNLKNDIIFYKTEKKLRPGDVMRFPSEYTFHDAIQFCKDRIKEENNISKKLQKQ